MRCVVVDASGFVVDVTPQPADVTTCTLVLASPSEVGSSPFAVDSTDAQTLLWGIAPLWITAWIFRAFLLPLRN
jgi:hypothetical protein